MSDNDSKADKSGEETGVSLEEAFATAAEAVEEHDIDDKGVFENLRKAVGGEATEDNLQQIENGFSAFAEDLASGEDDE